MRRTWIIVVLVVATVASTAGYQRGVDWKEFRYASPRLMADLNRPDALIRTKSLVQLPHDLLKAPIARDVLTEDLAFYYEQHEDRRGLQGAIKRIAYEHKLDRTDRVLAMMLDELAEVALWRDGKGALRHFAIVMEQRMLSKVLWEVAFSLRCDAPVSIFWKINNQKCGPAITERSVSTKLTSVTQPQRVILLSG